MKSIRSFKQNCKLTSLFLLSLPVFQQTSAFTPLLQNKFAATPTRPFQSKSTITKMSAANKDDEGQVVVVGSANQDLTSYTGVVPVLGQTVMGQTFDTSCGGKGANQAVAAASLGMVPVSMVCRVADDVFGQSLLNNFRKSVPFYAFL